MLIDKDLIVKAKNNLGERAASIIAEDLKLESWDDTSLKGCCPFHKEDTPSFVWDSKPNSNFFKCFGCSRTYNIIDHYINFRKLSYLEAVELLFQETGEKYRFGERGLKSNRDYVYPDYVFDPNRKSAEEYLGKRKISIETLDYADVQSDSHGNIVFHFYDENDVLVLVKYRPSHAINKDKKEMKSWCQKDKSTKHVLYNMNRIDPTKPLVITEGEIDCLSVLESGYQNVVSIPLGSQDMQWIATNWDWLEQFEKIIIWSDNDDPGIKMRKDACSRLGAWRTLFVEIPKKIVTSDGKEHLVKDANEILYYLGEDAVLDYINNAQEIPVEGVDNLARVDEFDIENAPGLYSGIEGLDKVIYKFLFGSVVLVTGQRGGGKSSYVNQAFICESLHQGHDCFIFSGELSAPVVKSWLELVMAGREKIKMKDDFIHIIDKESKEKMRKWYDNRVWIYNDESNKVDDILDKAVSVIRKYGVKTILLDNLMTIDIGANGDNLLLKQKEFIVRLTNLAKLYNVLFVLIAHPRKIQSGMALVADDISGSSDLTNLAGYVVSIHRYTQREKEGEKDNKGNFKKGKEGVQFDVKVEIMKNRYTGKLGSWDLYFDYQSYRFYRTTSELFKRYKWNEDSSPLSTKDPNNHTPSPFDTNHGD
jgi:twinkle protein